MCQAMQAESVSGPAAAQAAGLQRKELLPLSVETRKGFDRAREGFDGEGWGRVGESFFWHGLFSDYPEIIKTCNICYHNNPAGKLRPPSLLQPIQRRGSYLGRTGK